MATVTCLETEQPEGRRSHAWQATGLDNVDGVLCSTRRCTWCGRAEHKGYGGPPKTWRPSV